MGWVFLALFIFILVAVLPIYFLIAISDLKKRVMLLEAGTNQRPRGFIAQHPVRPTTEKTEPPEETVIEKQPVADRPPPAKAAWNPTPKVTRERKNFVFSHERISKAIKWAQDNWVFILAGVSLALAGVFLVQYGVENGLLSPQLRVLAAIGFGALLIAAGEYIRRRTRGDESGSFALLPSVFAGAGLVAVFAGVISARQLYGLIEPGTAFALLAATGALAVLLGWVYGPLLAALGVAGALAAPFLVGGSSDDPGLLHLYFALITAVALAIDAYKRWAWLSALALIGAFGASGLLLLASQTGYFAVVFALAVALLAAIIPELSITPRQNGPRMSQYFLQKAGRGNTLFPTRVAFGAFAMASLYLGWIYMGEPSLFWLVLMALGLLVLAGVFWFKDAAALADLAFVPAVVGLAVVLLEASQRNGVAAAWFADTLALRPQLTAAPKTVLLLMAGGLATSLIFAWRSYFLTPLKLSNSVFAAGFAPWLAIVIEIYWRPSLVLGSGVWAIYLMVITFAMVILTERFSRIEPESRTRTALFALSAMSMLSFMMVVLLGDIALTLSIAVMVLAAAWLGERVRLTLLDWYIQAGVVAVTYRLVVDPGLYWAFDAPLWQVLLAYMMVLALLSAAYLVKRKGRLAVLVVLESVIWTLAGIMITLLLVRWMDSSSADLPFYTFASFAGLVWLMLAANQMYRLKAAERLFKLRVVLAVAYNLAAVLFLGLAVVVNPAILSGESVIGWVVFGSLGAAYLLPAIVLGVMAWKLSHLPQKLRLIFGIIAAGFVTLHIGLEIRHFWQGDAMARSFMSKPELYTYTVAMILAAILLLALAFWRQSPGLRKLALAVVALVVIKVFFVDMSELDGLLRVGSFLALGLVAAMMAWVNRLLKINEAGQLAQGKGEQAE